MSNGIPHEIMDEITYACHNFNDITAPSGIFMVGVGVGVALRHDM